jgi:RNA polymerase sigma-70 factor (ECF subfamily)
MERVAAGDEQAHRIVARRLLPLARRVTRSLLRNAVEADDATQLSLMEILRSAGSYRGETAVERWAQRIIVRTTLRHIREQRRFYRVVDIDAEVSEVGAPSSKRDADEELPRPIDVYLAQVSDVQREAVILHHALGYTVPEIAEITGVTQNTAKARLLYGRRALRRLVRRDLNIGKGPKS